MVARATGTHGLDNRGSSRLDCLGWLCGLRFYRLGRFRGLRFDRFGLDGFVDYLRFHRLCLWGFHFRGGGRGRGRYGRHRRFGGSFRPFGALSLLDVRFFRWNVGRGSGFVGFFVFS
jgi:hypothetical protein